MHKDHTADNECLLEVRNLWKIFAKHPVDLNGQDNEDLEGLQNNGAVIAVKDVSFQVNRGEVFVIMGLSGSGKSTLIRCIPRLIDPTSGEIIVKGRNVLEMDEKELIEFRRYETAMVFQHYGLLPHRTVIENVAFGLKLRGVSLRERMDRARYALARVGLEGWEKHYPAQLSGGMRQRVGIARALVQETDLLLMDEPFSGLDPLIRREMQDTLIRLQKEVNKTIIFVTHDLSEAVRLGNRMAVMRKGEFVQQGTPEEIMTNPADEYVERFVADERAILSGSKRQSFYVSMPNRTNKQAKSTSPSAPLAAAGRR
ncbi:MAG TPA: betaine/proline/choline family ABC transporter ATP-binding protein [Syntrophomonadaceae bacterium]|nr:betaine/proline/choline family ABC transporter ATP-binding protein [Syntrophomonadaceae bacterium]